MMYLENSFQRKADDIPLTGIVVAFEKKLYAEIACCHCAGPGI
jgi:hypothetical protein